LAWCTKKNLATLVEMQALQFSLFKFLTWRISSGGNNSISPRAVLAPNERNTWLHKFFGFTCKSPWTSAELDKKNSFVSEEKGSRYLGWQSATTLEKNVSGAGSAWPFYIFLILSQVMYLGMYVPR
jgi:hypothetical protein